MSSRKRSRCSSINSINQFSGDRLVIKLGAAENDSNPQLAADILTLRSCCSCCEGLPADAAVWDISSVLVGGTPVKRQTVVEWLNAVYSRLDDSCYEEQKESEVQTMAALFELLTFADAVGSRRGILLHCIGKLSRLMASAKLAQPPVGEEEAVHLVYLPTDGSNFVWCGQDRLQLEHRTPTDYGHIADPALDQDHKLAFITSVAQQTEQLLYLAHKLNLDPLVTCLHTFLSGCCHGDYSLLYGSLGRVLTPRVLDEASKSQPGFGSHAWVSSMLTQPCGLTSGPYHVGQLLKPLRFSDRDERRSLSPLRVPYGLRGGAYGGYSPRPPGYLDDYAGGYGGYGSPPSYGRYGRFASQQGEAPEETRFTARLTRDFMGSKSGEEVNVELDVFRGTARIGMVDCRAQLLLGPVVTDATDFQRMMSWGPPEPQAAAAHEEEGDQDDH